MKTFKINNKIYSPVPFDFNFICDLEDMGVSLERAGEKPMSMLRAYFAKCTGRGTEFAGKEMEAHMINGGSLKDIMDVMAEEMKKSDFFRSLRQSQETNDQAG